jgi:hypothetical protein
LPATAREILLLNLSSSIEEAAMPAGSSPTHDASSGHRGGKRSHTGAQGRTKEQLYNEAKKRNIEGRSSMSKAELERAIAR